MRFMSDGRVGSTGCLHESVPQGWKEPFPQAEVNLCPEGIDTETSRRMMCGAGPKSAIRFPGFVSPPLELSTEGQGGL
jgi:hypothetical protein